MNTPTLNIARLLNDLDQIRLESQPLAKHAVFDLDAHDKALYAGFLAAMLLTDNQISDNQSRLFGRLLAAMGLDAIQARLYEQAALTTQDTLRDFIRLMEEHPNLRMSFLVDALVLCRLDSPLTPTQCRVLSELVDALQIHPQDLPRMTHLACRILGLPTTWQRPAQPDCQHIATWKDYLRIPLTEAMLKQGASHEWCVLDNVLEVDFPWTLENADIQFTDQGKLNTTADGQIRIEHCVLDKARMVFKKQNGQLGLALLDSELYGDYHLGANATALIINDGVSARIERTAFSTKQARALQLCGGAAPSLHNCTFEDCGHPEMPGGAISIYGDYTISGCQFTDCIAKIGGGIHARYLKPIPHCHFIRCKSTGYQSTNLECHDGGGMFVYSYYSNYDWMGEGCIFEESNVRLNYRGDSYTRGFKGTLTDSYLSLAGKIDGASNATIKNKKIKEAGVINNAELTKEPWWEF